MFHKIQPEQIQLPTFFDASGNILINQGSTGVSFGLSEGLNGDYNINGSLSVNSGALILSSNNQNAHLTGSFALGGSADFGGANNWSLNAISAIINGSGNVVLGTNSASIASGSSKNSILAGSNVFIPSGISGSTILKDRNNNYSPSVGKSNALFVSFESGVEIQHGELTVQEPINGEGGVFSFGHAVVITGELISASGYLATRIDGATGDIGFLSGEVTGIDYQISGLLAFQSFMETGYSETFINYTDASGDPQSGLFLKRVE